MQESAHIGLMTMLIIMVVVVVVVVKVRAASRLRMILHDAKQHCILPVGFQQDSPRFAVPNWMRPELRCSDERKKDEALPARRKKSSRLGRCQVSGPNELADWQLESRCIAVHVVQFHPLHNIRLKKLPVKKSAL